MFDAYGSHLSLPDLSQTGRRDFLHLLRSHDRQIVGLRLDLGHDGLSPKSAVDRKLSQLDRAMDAARGLNAPLVCVEGQPRTAARVLLGLLACLSGCNSDQQTARRTEANPMPYGVKPEARFLQQEFPELRVDLPQIADAPGLVVFASDGSIAWRASDGGLKVGPASAGADPGPMSYGRGGTRPTVTDAHLLLGRIPPGLLGLWEWPGVSLTVFLGVLCLIAFQFYLGRVLHHLNPSKAIPGRVRAALDTLTEGLLVLEEEPREVTPFAQLKVNWAKTKVWSEGGYYARVFFNVESREPRGTIPAPISVAGSASTAAVSSPRPCAVIRCTITGGWRR